MAPPHDPAEGGDPHPSSGTPKGDTATEEYFWHSSARRVNTDIVITRAIAAQYPALELVTTPELSCNLLAFAAAGNATYSRVEDTRGKLPSYVGLKVYEPPARRLDGDAGVVADRLTFAKFLYKWRDAEFIVYLVNGRDGSQAYPAVVNYYILTADKPAAQALIRAAGRWTGDLHAEVWVFDMGLWQKSAELYQSVQGASWDAVILDPHMKKAIIHDHLSFFESRATYARLKVPWKRGIIYHGPPGNGKTISIKAMMHTLYALKDPIPTLYVRSLKSFAGPEYSVKQIFLKARQFAPCYLVFEDLDTIVSDSVRSYFLNEVDGLKSNDGIFMIGSTNHLDRLDPGISKRPSRFDRKYFFPDPNLEERIAYCHFWQSKLADNRDIEFPDKLCGAIAEITDGFSFAYIQEAFVAALLVIAGRTKEIDPGKVEEIGDGWIGVAKLDDNDDLDGLILWVEIKKQIKILRGGMEEGGRRGGGYE